MREDELLPVLDRLATPTGSAQLCEELGLALSRLYHALTFLVDAGLARMAEEGGFVLTAAGMAIRHDVVAVRELATTLGPAA